MLCLYAALALLRIFCLRVTTVGPPSFGVGRWFGHRYVFLYRFDEGTVDGFYSEV